MSHTALYGIAVFHHIGDVLCSTPIARQLKADDPCCRIVWYTSKAGEVAVRENPDIDELVVIDGDQYELDGLIPSLRTAQPWTRFFTPAAYMNYDAVPGGSIYNPRGTIFGLVKAGAKLHWTVPFIFPFRLTEGEKAEAATFWQGLPAGLKILVETDYRSEQSPWTDDWNLDLLAKLEHLKPVFVFTAKHRPPFFNDFHRQYSRSVWCDLPFRLNAELFNRCDAYVGVSSGISCLTFSDYCRTDVPRIEVTRGEHWGGAELEHHSELFLCYSRQKFHEALDQLAARLAGDAPVADLPANPVVTTARACGNCGGEELETYHTPEWRRCRGCLQVSRVSQPAPSEPLVTIDALGTALTSSPVGTYLRAELEPSTAEAVFVSGVLESLTDARQLFERIQFQLRARGTVTLAAKNREGVVASSRGSAWDQLRIGDTRTLFSPRSLKETLIQAGFVIERCETATLHADRTALLQVLQGAHPGANAEMIEALAAEVDRRGGGSTILITARKRGSYKGRTVATFSGVARSSMRTSKPEVTVVIPVGADPRFLRECLQSVCAQTFTKWRAVVVPDGLDSESNRRLSRTVTELSDARFQLLVSAGGGPDEARDVGAAAADTSWLLFLDSDDVLAPAALERLLQATGGVTEPLQVAMPCARQSGAGSRILQYAPPERNSILNGYPFPTAALIPRLLWLRARGWNRGLPRGTFAPNFWMSVLQLHARVTVVDEPLIAIRVGETDQLHRLAQQHWRHYLALTQIVHHQLFDDQSLRSALSFVRSAPESLVEELRDIAARFPGLPYPRLFLGVNYEGNRLFSEAQREYDMWRILAPAADQKRWEPLAPAAQNGPADRPSGVHVQAQAVKQQLEVSAGGLWGA